VSPSPGTAPAWSEYRPGGRGWPPRAVTDLIEEFGFDVLDAGDLAEGRRFQPGTPAYGVRLDAAALRAALAAA
jgi:hypothetical protein